MAKQTINIGSGELAGNGESIRSAFEKVNSNFTELYDTDPVQGPTGPQGDPGIQGDVGPTGPQDFSAIAEHVLPAADLTYDLGSTSSQWRSLYVGTSTVYFGGTALSITPTGSLTINGNPIGNELVSITVPTVGGTASAGESGITYLSGDLSKWAIFTEGAFTVGTWTDVQPGWTVTDNNGFTDTIAGRGSFGAASFQTTVNNWPSPASGKTYVFTSPDYQAGYTDPIEITVGVNDWTFDTDGNLTFPDNTVQTTAFTATSYISKSELQSVVAASTDFADFQSRIAAL